jgi:hypothetical protein
MIAAAKADGRVEAAEQASIFAEMDKLDLSAEDKAFVVGQLRGPLDVDAVAKGHARRRRQPSSTPRRCWPSMSTILPNADISPSSQRG